MIRPAADQKAVRNVIVCEMQTRQLTMRLTDAKGGNASETEAEAEAGAQLSMLLLLRVGGLAPNQDTKSFLVMTPTG